MSDVPSTITKLTVSQFIGDVLNSPSAADLEPHIRSAVSIRLADNTVLWVTGIRYDPLLGLNIELSDESNYRGFTLTSMYVVLAHAHYLPDMPVVATYRGRGPGFMAGVVGVKYDILHGLVITIEEVAK